MSISALATIKVPAYIGNYTKGRESAISKITIHHMSGTLTAEACGGIFQRPGRGGSSHYGIGYDGGIGNYVDEKDTAWTDSNWVSNSCSVTIETSNSKNEYPWPVSDAALNSLIKLVADIAIRNKLGTLVKGKNLTWHQMYAATDCPGPYLLGKMDYIVAEANKIINGGATKPATPAAKPATTAAFGETVGRKYNSINGQRLADHLVVYKDVPKATTNAYGYEVAVDANGIAIANPKYVGETVVPAGGFVLSGHGNSGNWIKDNIRAGYYVTVNQNGKVYVDKWVHKAVNGTNTTRLADQLVVYKGRKTTGTNQYGFEAPVDKNGKVTADPAYKGNTAIPTGGFVISGHGKAGDWLKANIKKGKTVSFNGKMLFVK